MSQISRVPLGLQDFLGSKNFGDNPSELAQTVAPIIDMAPFIGIEKEKWKGEGFPVFTASSSVSESVPDGEIWLLRGIGFEHAGAGLAAGDGYTASCSMSKVPLSTAPANSHPLSGTPYQFRIVSFLTSAKEHNMWTLDNIVAWPGTTIKWAATNIIHTSGQFTSIAYLRYVELKI